MIITKGEVLDALATEPLRARQFVDSTDNGNPTCHVCAVGAMLRRKGLTNNQIWFVGSRLIKQDMVSVGMFVSKEVARNKAVELTQQGKYLHALSIIFEHSSNTMPLKEDSYKYTKEFVLAFFPDSFTFHETVEY